MLAHLGLRMEEEHEEMEDRHESADEEEMIESNDIDADIEEEQVTDSDPWEFVGGGEWRREQKREVPFSHRETVHHVIEGTAEGAPAGTLRSYFILSSLSTRKDSQLISICPITGNLQYRGVLGLDLFMSEGDARAHLTDKMGLRIINSARGIALLGAVITGSRLNICLCTKSEARMTLPTGEPVFTVTEVKWTPVVVSYPCQARYASTYSNLVSDFNIPNLHYYTQPFVDITRPYPSNETSPDTNFVWNTFLTEPFRRIGLGDWTVKLLQGVAVGKHVSLAKSRYPPARNYPPGMKQRLKNFYRKHNPEKLDDIKTVLDKFKEREEELFAKLRNKYGDEPERPGPEDDSDEEKPTGANMTLLTRRWSRYPGTRYNARGIDSTGAPANELECELMVSHAGQWASFIWRRGSVPVKWYSALGSTVKVGQATFVIKDNPYENCERYWDALAKRYAGWGSDCKAPPITCMSLLHTEPEHGELILVEHFQQSLKAVKAQNPKRNVDLFGFDWHRTVKQLGLNTAVEGTWALLAGPLRAYGVSGGSVEVAGNVENKSITSMQACSSLVSPKKEGNNKRGGAFGVIRGLVSQKKLRFKEGDFNLDLTYITDRIIAMGFPSSGAEGCYRNHIDDVEKFFESRHKGHFRIYNLCTEREYDVEMRFGGNYRRWPFDDHNAPTPISMIPELVEDALQYMAADPKNVVAAHCKAGKGRTGVMISAMLMAGAARESVPGSSAAAALGFFGAARTRDGLGVTIPSQRRYIHYYQEALAKYDGKIPEVPVKLRVTKIVIQSPVKQGATPHLYALVHEGPKWVNSEFGKRSYERGPTVLKWDSRKSEPPQPAGARFTLFDLEEGKDGGGPIVRGDVKISVNASRAIRGDEHLFHLWFNTSFVNEELIQKDEPMRFSKPELDKACKDEKHTTFRRDLQVEVYFQPVLDDEEQALSPRRAARSIGPSNSTEAIEDEDDDDKGCVVTAIGKRQSGILRLNCVDSLDRTNLASFFMALQVAGELRRELRNDKEEYFPLQGKTLAEVRASLGEDMVGYLAEAFVANGDVCSLLYTNTPATHTDAIREMSPRLGKAPSNAVVSVMRRYQNTVNDNTRHKGFFAFLGHLKRPKCPPTLVSSYPSCVISHVPHQKMKEADPSVLLYSPPSGEFPWMTQIDEHLVYTVHLPDVGAEITEIALCFRYDCTGDDETFPTRIEVSSGTTIEQMETCLSDITVPRTRDFTWLYYELQTPSSKGARLVSLKFSGCVGSIMTLGGIRVLGSTSKHQVVGSNILHSVVSKSEKRSVFALDDHCVVKSINVRTADEVQVLCGTNFGDLVACKALEAQVFKCSKTTPIRLVAVEHQGGFQDDELQVDGFRSPPVFYRPPPPPSSGLSLHTKQLSRKRARVLAIAQDDEMLGALFVLVTEGASVTGVQIITAQQSAQARGISVGVSDDTSVQSVPSPHARKAVIKYAEDFLIPRCAEGTLLDYHFNEPVKGSLVRVEVRPMIDTSLVAAAKVVVLVSGNG
eukprot:TRINITY_DN7032_c0_g1_i1.p1 TRINITY_DN7032_c0_g1~~TRINITY_DN7032_c0_g1_i1.p1  ORF type:complete len:1506 (+),score=200.05 TRINITY_DN7032_c0_g1_i1:1247-5764(+)